MTRYYPFFTQIAYIAHFWNSVGPIYSTKKVANQKRCVGGVPFELNLFVPFRIEKAHSGKKGRFGSFDNQRIKSDSQIPEDKT